MQKNLLLFIIFISFVFYSCLDYDLPEKINFELEGSINLPIKTARGNWATSLIKSLGDSLPKDVEIYNVNYGQDIQSFCVYIPIEISDSLDPNDYLEGIADLTKLEGMQALEIKETIEIPPFDDFVFSYQISKLVSIPQGMSSVTIPIEIPIPFKLTALPVSISDDFLHALIEEGYFNIEMDLSEGNVTVSEDQFTIKYEINISQEPDAYNGLEYPDPSGQVPVQTSDRRRPLKGQNINRNEIEIGGTVTLQPKPEGGNVSIKDPDRPSLLEGELKITMNFTKFREMDWDFRKISNELKADPLSLASVAKNINWIDFKKCDVDANSEPVKGIGINMHLTELSDELKLEMSVGCDALEFQARPKQLFKGNNVFGNEKDFTLELDGYKNDVKKLQFNIAILPSGNKDIIHLVNLEAGKPLSIKGEAKLFQYWAKAEVNMKEALKGSANESGAFTGEFPDTAKGQSFIDLSSLDDYLEGFNFMPEDVTAMVYLSGPDDTINSHNTIDEIVTRLKIDAKYSGINDPLPILEQDPVTLAKKHVVIKENPDYIDEHGSYKIQQLPSDGNPVIDFDKIINARPNDLAFQYNGMLPDVLIVTPDMFFDENNESVSPDIAASIIISVNFKLVAVDEVSQIKFSDMFKDQNDLLDRAADKNDPSKPAKDSMFTSLNVGYIKFTIDFTDAFFAGGKLFIEKNNDIYKPILFPEGISVDGSRIAVNIRNKDFEIVRDNFIHPDLRLEFAKDDAITIPRNMGLTRVKIEAKGKNSLYLDL
jgi:hypothetical protein